MNSSCQASGLKYHPSPVQAGRLTPVNRTTAYPASDIANSSVGRRNNGSATAKISSSTT